LNAASDYQGITRPHYSSRPMAVRAAAAATDWPARRGGGPADPAVAGPGLPKIECPQDRPGPGGRWTTARSRLGVASPARPDERDDGRGDCIDRSSRHDPCGPCSVRGVSWILRGQSPWDVTLIGTSLVAQEGRKEQSCARRLRPDSLNACRKGSGCTGGAGMHWVREPSVSQVV